MLELSTVNPDMEENAHLRLELLGRTPQNIRESGLGRGVLILKFEMEFWEDSGT